MTLLRKLASVINTTVTVVYKIIIFMFYLSWNIIEKTPGDAGSSPNAVKRQGVISMMFHDK